MGGRYNPERFKINYANPIFRAKSQASNRRYQLRRAAENRSKILEILGGRCIKCGFSDIRALQLDHIKGGGNRDRGKYPNSSHMIAFYLENPEAINKSLQLLCANCNWIKRFENKETPKKYKD